MAITNFIPTVWSEMLLQELDKNYVGVAHCNRQFEGDIREKGSRVRICGLNPIAIGNYEKNTDMNEPAELSDFSTDLLISEARYFHFQIDDIDRAQTSPDLMTYAIKNAASRLAMSADTTVFNLYDQATQSLAFSSVTPDNVIENFLKVRTSLLQRDVFNPDDIVIEVTPKVAELIIRAKAGLTGNAGNVLETGCIGNIAGCKVYVSNNLLWNGGDPDPEFHHCIVRTKRAVAFAEQLSEIEAYRPERRFADAVKGLYLFGCRIVYPKEFVAVEISIDPGV